MRTRLLVVIFFFIISGIRTIPLHALDLGLYANLTGGTGSVEPYSDNHDFDTEDQSGSGGGIGLILNGYFGDNLLINRFMMMYEYNYIEIDSSGSDSGYELTSLSLYDTLGFVLSSSASNTIWLGPQLGFRSITASDDDDTEYDGVGGSIGIVLGADFSLGGSTLLGIEAGVRFSASNIESSESGGYGADIYSTEGFLGISFMIRM